MAAAAPDPPTFPLFTSLPRELRDQIWRDALPNKVGPSLSYYRKGCWCPRRLSESDEGHDPDNDENNLRFEFRHELLDDIRFEIALVHVNREARDLALVWVREQGIEIRPREDFVRPFDLTSDALYVPLDQWDDFLGEPDDRLSQPDLLDQLVDCKSDLTRIAVPAALLRSEAASLADIFHYFCNLKALLIVVDPQPDPRSTDDNVTVQYRWDFESVWEGAFFWNDDRVSFNASGYVGDEAVYGLIEEASGILGKGLVDNYIRSFEVRPVFAVRR